MGKGEMETLQASIKEHGLIHPIAVLEIEGGFRLLAGQRRYTACKNLGWKEIPANIFSGEMKSSESRTIELIENLNRKNLSWQEEATLRAEIDRLLKEELGIRPAGRMVKKDGTKVEGWSSKETADLTGVDRRTVQNDIQLVQSMEIFPELRKCQTRDQAIKKLIRIKAESGTGFSAQAAGDPEVEALKPKLVKLYRTRPFEQDLEKVKGFQATVLVLTKLCTVKRLEMLFELCGHNAYVVGVCDADLLKDAGFKILTKLPAIWTWVGSAFGDAQKLQTNYEQIFYGVKGSPVLAKQGRSAIFSTRKVPPTLQTHETEKPIELWQMLLEAFTHQSGRVLVPFAQEGNAVLAALNLSLRVIAYDDDAKHFGVFEKKALEGTPGSYTSYPGSQAVEEGKEE
jgi:hypothetical protein